MVWLCILLGLLLGLVAYRIRGTWWGKWPGRVACALLVALPVALDWPWGTGLYLPVVLASLWAVSRPHNPGARTPAELLWLALGGLLFTAAATLAVLGLGHWEAALLLAAGGLGKGLCYLLPRGPAPDHKFVWKESAFGGCWGAAVGGAIWLVLGNPAF